jgi:hypothetical protein
MVNWEEFESAPSWPVVKGLSRNSPGGTKKGHENPQSV